MAIGEEAFLEPGIINVVQGGFFLDGVDGGGGGGLAEDHEDGFHADGAVGDMGGGEADGDEQVGAFVCFGEDSA
ncbi:MAG: hypothetical protein RI897_3417 [Verrucomicrobiota bacterium]